MSRAMLVVLSLLLTAGSAQAQIPERFENLKVLPQDITRDSLVRVMRGFASGLGVRCVYCHVGEDTPDFAGVDFDSDEKLTKRTAREMLRMVARINQTIAAIPDRGPTRVEVRCLTCHRGISRPVPLEDSIYRAAVARGGAGAVTVYDSLRERYHGSAAFDFGPQPLVRAAERLSADGRHVDAVAVLLRNADAHPLFWGTYFALGRTYETLNRTADAVDAYRATLERLPNHPPSVARLRALGADASP